MLIYDLEHSWGLLLIVWTTSSAPTSAPPPVRSKLLLLCFTLIYIWINFRIKWYFNFHVRRLKIISYFVFFRIWYTIMIVNELSLFFKSKNLQTESICNCMWIVSVILCVPKGLSSKEYFVFTKRNLLSVIQVKVMMYYCMVITYVVFIFWIFKSSSFTIL